MIHVIVTAIWAVLFLMGCGFLMTAEEDSPYIKHCVAVFWGMLVSCLVILLWVCAIMFGAHYDIFHTAYSMMLFFASFCFVLGFCWKKIIDDLKPRRNDNAKR